MGDAGLRHRWFKFGAFEKFGYVGKSETSTDITLRRVQGFSHLVRTLVDKMPKLAVRNSQSTLAEMSRDGS